MSHRLRFTAMSLSAVVLVLGGPRMTHAKRRPPAEIKPIEKGHIRYVVPHFGVLHGKEQNGGYVQAWEASSGKLLWDRMIYRVVYDAKIERDAQDVFIARVSVEDGTLVVENELGESFEMDLANGQVKGLVKKSGRTEVPVIAVAAESNMTVVYLVLLKKGSAATGEETPATKAIQEAHMANIRQMWQAQKVIVAGPIGDAADLRGVFVFKAASLEDAKSLAATDPAVKAGRLVATVYPWWVDKRALPEAGSYCTAASGK